MPNRLAGETSPYLLQHADNPVDWYPWGDEAFRTAAERDRPILLSVGYSSCHWCHVMAHESFEDPATATVMNELFVNVKVDREERPDVDTTYMAVLQATTGRGGWPMTVFLTPDRKPFFAGTYFPAVDRPGIPSLKRVLVAVADAWTERRSELETVGSRLAESVAARLPTEPVLPDRSFVDEALRVVLEYADRVNGGFGTAPKFPQEPVIEFLLRAGGSDSMSLLRTTLDAMAAGGIRDHIGGGFARYSVDGSWTIPHFEKMLYTNAQLARVYLRAGQVLSAPAYTKVTLDTLGYMLHDLRLPGGGFASAEDADSEGGEGTFYLWDLDEFESVVGPDLAPLAVSIFGVTADGNFEGRNHLRIVDRDAAVHLGIDPVTARAMLDEIRARLRIRRSMRPRPGMDDKVVTVWNGLAIRALAEAGAVTGDARLTHAAGEAASFLLDKMIRSRRLMRSWRGERTSVPGFADDYASFSLGLFSLYQATGNTRWYREALHLVDEMVRLFADPDGGIFTNGIDVTAPLARVKDLTDSPTPSATSMAAEALLAASLLTGRTDLRLHAESMLRSGVAMAKRSPMATGHLLGVLSTLHAGTKEVAITGPGSAGLAAVVWEEFRPGVVLAVDEDGSGETVVPLLRGRWSDTPRAFVCEGLACDLPVSTPEELRTRLA
jgi:uncharacterized protein YyaL (SSP411 family)